MEGLLLLCVFLPSQVRNAFSVSDSAASGAPDVWTLALDVHPWVVVGLIAVHILGKYKHEVKPVFSVNWRRRIGVPDKFNYTIYPAMFPITHQNLILRPFETRDAEPFAGAARESIDTVGRWMPWCVADYSAATALDWFALCTTGLAANTACDIGVFSEDGALLGGVGLNQFNRLHNVANLGYWVRASRQRRGVCLRAAQALAMHGFMALGFNRIEIVIAEGNEPSNAVARKLGAVFEGHARNRLLIWGVAVTASVYSLVATDF